MTLLQSIAIGFNRLLLSKISYVISWLISYFTTLM